jgi:PAS domain-containing protein
MDDHDQIYGHQRAAHLQALLRHLAERIQALDREGRLLEGVPELQRLLGDARSELFHYEVRSTYDTPETAESRRIVEEAKQNFFTPDEFEDDDPWRPPKVD